MVKFTISIERQNIQHVGTCNSFICKEMTKGSRAE